MDNNLDKIQGLVTSENNAILQRESGNGESDPTEVEER